MLKHPIDRFLNKINKTPTCWLWEGCLRTDGYGCFRLNGKTRTTHRLAYEWLVAPIPLGLQVLHRCDNPSCVNPNHLWLGTHGDNMRDAAAKGRLASQKGEHPRLFKSHCLHGHPYSSGNTRRRGNGTRVCIECKRSWGRRDYHNKKTVKETKCA